MKFTITTLSAFVLGAATTIVAQDRFAGKYQNPAILPAKVDSQQNGFNDCIQRYGTNNSQALCQNIYINSVKDFCVYGLPKRGPTVGDSEEVVIAYCIKSGYGTRLIPDGTIHGAHFLKTPSYLQVTGVGDFTTINIKKGDAGGELDPHSYDGTGNPKGGLVFTRALNADHTYRRLPEWQHFISDSEFCLRACIPGPYDRQWCPHIYDVMGCQWNEPANYSPGQFEQCDGTEGQWPGVYNGKQWFQGQKPTPQAQKPGKSSNCRPYPTIAGGPALYPPKANNKRRASPPAPTPRFNDADL